MLQAMGQPTPQWPGHYVELPAGQIYVRVAPAEAGAEAALFIHGLGGSATNWTDLMGLLSQSAADRPAVPALACSAVDLPGFGCSPPPADGDYSISAHASAVIDLIERQGQWPVHVIGNSMGGAIGTRVAARRPDLVRTLTLISPALPDLRPRLLPLRLALATAPGIGQWLMARVQRLPAEARADRTIMDLYNDPALVHPVRRSEQIAEVQRRDELAHANDALILSARSLVAEYARRGPNSLWRDAARTTAPALILHGSHDRLVSPAMAAKAARAFHGARVMVLAQVGHVAMMERPAIVAAEIRAFLNWLPAAGEPVSHLPRSASTVPGDQAPS